MNKWINTNIKPAPNNLEVLLCSKHGNIYIGKYDHDYDLFFDDEHRTLPTPTHWMLLPEVAE